MLNPFGCDGGAIFYVNVTLELLFGWIIMLGRGHLLCPSPFFCLFVLYILSGLSLVSFHVIVLCLFFTERAFPPHPIGVRLLWFPSFIVYSWSIWGHIFGALAFLMERLPPSSSLLKAWGFASSELTFVNRLSLSRQMRSLCSFLYQQRESLWLRWCFKLANWFDVLLFNSLMVKGFASR